MKQIYFNHDGNIDDLVSYLLLLQAPDIKLLGVGAIDADGYIDPSVEACRKMTDLFNLFDYCSFQLTCSQPISSRVADGNLFI